MPSILRRFLNDNLDLNVVLNLVISGMPSIRKGDSDCYKWNVKF